MLSVLVNLMQVDDISVFHLRQDMYFFLYVLPGHASPGWLQPLLFDKFGGVFMTSVFLEDSINCRKLATEMLKNAKISLWF